MKFAKKRATLTVTFVLFSVFFLLAALNALAADEEQKVTIGTRIPYEYFITTGVGEDDHDIHTGSYDAALQNAKIEDCNIMVYSSVMPREAKKLNYVPDLTHGSVLETIMAEMSASYLNFLVTNGVVLAPRYWKPGLPKIIKDKDELAAIILRDVFPDRKIITIDVMAVNWGGGGIHCITQQEPTVT